MKTFPISRIVVAANRQRKEFDPAKLHEFADGIEKRGLLHPIVARWLDSKPGEAQALCLVAGERRLRAITDLADLGIQIKCDGTLVPLGHIPYTLLQELDPLAYEEAELDENIHRQDLTWQERAAAHSRLATLRAAQAADRGEAPPSVADLAVEVRGSSEGIHHDLTRKELIVARFLDNPEVSAAKSVGDAFKVLKKQEAAATHRALGISVGTTFTADAHSAVNQDSLVWLRGYEANSFDCIIADPPYGMGADEFGDSGGLAAGAHGYADSWEYAEKCYTTLAVEGFRIAKPRAHAYVFCDIDNLARVKGIFFVAGWTVFRTPLLWYKRHGSRAPWPEMGPQRKYETLIYAVKGKRPVLKLVGDVLDYPADTNLGHAAQKPVALYQDLLSRTCLPGDSAIDPFCGTGPIFPAAHALRIRATGVELDPTSYGIAVQRITELRQQSELDLLVRG
jgi:site-specific DNA-methyltransferase (adenine-specific)